MTESLPGQVVQPSGPGHELLEGPVAFYLTYQEQIEAWAALRKDLAIQMTNWYLEVFASAIDLPGWTRSSKRTVVTFAMQGRSEDLTVGIMWDKANPTKPYVGVSAATQAADSKFMASLPDGRPPGYQRYNWELPAWKWLNPTRTADPWWTDLSAHIDWLVSEINHAINLFGAAIDAATAPATASGGPG